MRNHLDIREMKTNKEYLRKIENLKISKNCNYNEKSNEKKQAETSVIKVLKRCT